MTRIPACVGTNPAIRPSARSRGGLTTKTHALVDGRRLPLVVILTRARPGQGPISFSKGGRGWTGSVGGGPREGLAEGAGARAGLGASCAAACRGAVKEIRVGVYTPQSSAAAGAVVMEVSGR